MKKKNTKKVENIVDESNSVIEMKVSDYVEEYNSKSDKKINRHDVYKMIKEGKLKAHKGYKGAWIIEIDKKNPKKKKSKTKSKKYTVKEYVEEYNKKFPNAKVTVPEVRKFLSDGIIKGKKVDRKWEITSSPSKRIK